MTAVMYGQMVTDLPLNVLDMIRSLTQIRTPCTILAKYKFNGRN